MAFAVQMAIPYLHNIGHGCLNSADCRRTTMTRATSVRGEFRVNIAIPGLGPRRGVQCHRSQTHKHASRVLRVSLFLPFALIDSVKTAPLRKLLEVMKKISMCVCHFFSVLLRCGAFNFTNSFQAEDFPQSLTAPAN